MFAENSAPVRTPSYMPRVTLYGYDDIDPGQYVEYWALTFSHHSNGQSGEFFNEDGNINRINGSFSTNYLEFFSGFWTPERGTEFGYRITVHLPLNRDRELEDIPYGFWRASLIMPYYFDKLYYIRNFWKGRWPQVEVGYIFGDVAGTNGFFNKVQLSVIYRIDIKILEDFDFLIWYYLGQDYYNIWYKRRLNVLRIGFISDVGF